ncbi:MAG: Asp-tRNA(Asn)/Glu-tRNA(Gln) amidotransferase subunit GatA [Anaerolineae bacterium]|nr:Asp-tRNA(Asn)/Glu-tRNA(Gln) amidotransferase subunit GatA [Anaerolineae bacterium]
MGLRDLYTLTVQEALALLQSGEISSVELTQAILERIRAIEDRVHAYIKVLPEQALDRARYADKRRAEGDPAPLLGIPLAVKDNISVKGIETTCGSKILQGYVAPFDATVIRWLKDAGVVILGKTNMDEFAMGSSTENSAFYPTRNPWDLERVPGGSSGGSAAAVAAGEALAGLGTDTGGSVRQPAALCNLVGVRPTYGRCSRYGLVAFASSLDQVGTLTRTVADAALLLQTMAGHDPYDSTTWPDVPGQAPDDYVAALNQDIRGLRIGIPREYAMDGVQPDTAQAIQAALQTFVALGAELVEVSLPHSDYALPVYYLIAPAEASSNLARFDGVRYGLRTPAATVEAMMAHTRGDGFGAEVARRIMLGTYALSAGYYDAYYLKAQKVRTLIRQDFDLAFEQVDVIVGPTSPVTAFRLGERTTDPLQMYLADIFTLSQALAGIPVVSLPCGFDAAGLPIGMQIIAPALHESRMLRAAYAYEQATDWHTRRAEVQ